MAQRRNYELFKSLLPDLQEWREKNWGGFWTLVANTDVLVQPGTGLFMVFDTVTRELALVLYSTAYNPVLISQTGGQYTTGVPGSSQIQIKDGGSGLALRAGSGRGGLKVKVTVTFS